MPRWMSVLPVLASYAISAAVFSRMPSSVTFELSALLSFGGPATTMPRWMTALLMPTLALAVWGLLLALAEIRGPMRLLPEWLLNEQTGAEATNRFEPTYNIVVFAVTALIFLAHVALIAYALDWPWWTYRLLTATLGAGIAVMGNVMPRVRQNWVVGLRTKSALTDPVLWTRVHRMLGVSLVVLGVLVVLISLFSAKYGLIVAVAGLLPAFVVSHLIGTSRRRTSP